MRQKTVTNLAALMSIAILATACSTVSQAETVMSGTQAAQTETVASGTQTVQAESRIHETALVTSQVSGTGVAEAAQTETAVSGQENPAPASKILIAYFSRWGNTEYPADVDATTSASIVVDGEERYGTTGYVAHMIQEMTGGTVHLIETAEAYSADFQEVISQNHREDDRGTRPALKETSLDINAYDVVFVGYPVWASDTPQAIRSFLEAYDFSGKTVIPFCTHDGYGAGASYQTVKEVSGAAVSLQGLAIEAKDVPGARERVSGWLAGLGMLKEQKEEALQITIGDQVLEGVLYDTVLAEEIKAHFPLTVSMVGFGGREYYGGIDFTPQNTEGGQLRFENGDITYCSRNNTMAIFYAQTDRPNLTMEVIPIGRVTSDLSVFDTLGDREEITFSLVH